jgi:hypothetical protein
MIGPAARFDRKTAGAPQLSLGAETLRRLQNAKRHGCRESGRRNLMKITQGKIATVRSGEVEFNSGEFEAVHLSDPERACLSE